MTVQLPANTFRLTTSEIRMFMRDQPQYNSLLDDIEFSDEDIALAMKLTVAKWNVFPPVSTVTGPEFLNEWILLCGVCSILLRSEGLRQKRNQLRTQDGNIAPIGLDDKEELYFRWAMMFNQEFEMHTKLFKLEQNMESILSYGPGAQNGLSSGYRYIGKYTV